MPTIAVDLSNVSEFENLPNGTYLGELTRFYHSPSSEEGKFGQLRAVYTVIDEGPLLGKTATEFLSLSPKAAFRIAAFLNAFGFELDDDFVFETDDEDVEVVEPDVIGAQVIFKVADRKINKGPRAGEVISSTELVSVEEMPDGTASAETADEEPEDEPDESEEEAPKPKAAVRRPVAAAKAPAKRTLR